MEIALRAEIAAAVAHRLIEAGAGRELLAGARERIGIAPDHRAVATDEEELLAAHRGDRFVDVGEVADLDRDRDDAREGAVLRIDALAEVDREGAAEPARHWHVDVHPVVVDVAQVLEEVAVGEIRIGARPLPRGVDDRAVLPSQRDRGDLRQRPQPLTEPLVELGRAGAAGKIRRRLDAERSHPRLHVDQG